MTNEEFLEKFNAKEEDTLVLVGDEALKAVERNGYALRYVKEQTEAVCLKAVESDGYALQYVNLEVFVAVKLEVGTEE